MGGPGSRAWGQASTKLRTALPTVDTRIAAYDADHDAPNGLNPDAVSAMLAGVVARYMVNPQGATSTSTQRTDGPFSTSQTVAFASYGKTLAGGSGQTGLRITPDDLDELVAAPSVMPRQIRTKAALAPGRLERTLRHGSASC
jgi:hypothetical protein